MAGQHITLYCKICYASFHVGKRLHMIRDYLNKKTIPKQLGKVVMKYILVSKYCVLGMQCGLVVCIQPMA
jgi:hypothetical protein